MYATAPALSEVFYTAWNTNKLDARGRQRLRSLLIDGANPEEQQIVNRILHAVRRGWVEVVA